ncbi:MAG: hypothetical protein ABS35_26265 [Kaistia sp. SCN 65-12]|nr:MAG: hypothetical protein ABS35_26265 [Kaistia sp. SCN 65-12]
MLGLRDLQAAFAGILRGDDQPRLEAVVSGDSIPAAARLRVHRHHIEQSLVAALAATFSTVQAIVGEDFFRAMARRYVAGDLPHQPVLAEYGAGFPAFIADYEPATSLPYLADVARLDWALNLAFHSLAANHLTAADLSSLPPERIAELPLALAPGAGVLRSSYPIDRIWQVSQPGAADGTVDLGAGGVSLLVLRREDDAAFVQVSEAEEAFLSALGRGETLERAVEVGFRTNDAFDLSTTFTRLLALKAIAATQHHFSERV